MTDQFDAAVREGLAVFADIEIGDQQVVGRFSQSREGFRRRARGIGGTNIGRCRGRRECGGRALVSSVAHWSSIVRATRTPCHSPLIGMCNSLGANRIGGANSIDRSRGNPRTHATDTLLAIVPVLAMPPA